MQKWGINVNNPEAEFRKIDQNFGGHILFDDFADYCIKRTLDIFGPSREKVFIINQRNNNSIHKNRSSKTNQNQSFNQNT